MLYDADQGAKQDRYNRACATPRNRCNGNGMYNSCDEYPFESTSDADLVDAVSRCVTVNAQSSESFLPRRRLRASLTVHLTRARSQAEDCLCHYERW